MGLRTLTRGTANARRPVPFAPGATHTGGDRPFPVVGAGPPVVRDRSVIDDIFAANGNFTYRDPMTIPVFWNCVSMISEAIATLPPNSTKLDEKGKPDRRMYPNRPIVEDPFPLWGRVRFLSYIVRCLLLRGNAFGILGDFDDDGYPRQVAPIDPGQVMVEMGVDGFARYYLLANPMQPHLKWPAGDILHIGGYQHDDGPLGIGVLDYAGGTTDMSFKTIDYMVGGLAGAGVPSGVLTVDRAEFTQEQADAILTRWMAAHSGAVRRPAILPASMAFQPLSMNFTDADINTVRGWNAVDITQFFSIPPWLVGVSLPGSSTTYSNAAEQMNVFKVLTLNRWTVRIDQALTELTPGRTVTELDYSEMLRPTSAAQVEAWSKEVEMGTKTINEVRADMMLGAVEWGDEPGNISQQIYADQTTAFAASKGTNTAPPKGGDEALAGKAENEPDPAPGTNSQTPAQKVM